MRKARIVSIAGRGLAAALLAAFTLGGQLHAIVPDAPEYPAFGGGIDQILRFYASALGRQSVPDGPEKCLGNLGFLDEAGQPIGPTMFVDLAPGGATFIELAYGSVLGRRGERREIRPTFQYLEGSGECGTSVEVYDRYTQRDQVHRSSRPKSPRTMPEYGMLGAAWGQTVRLSLAIVDPNNRSLVDPNVKVTLAFFDNGGKPVGPTKTFSPGQALEFLDFNLSGFVPAVQRTAIRPVITIDFGASTPVAFDNWARTAVQAFDTATGFTQVLDEPLW